MIGHLVGEVVSCEPPAALAGVTVFVRLVDVRHAGAPAVVVAEIVLDDPWSRLGRASFSLTAENLDAGGLYCVSAHVDRDGDRRVGSGDSVNTVSYPVLTRGHPGQVRVEVHRIE